MNKTDLMACGPDKLKNTNLIFRYWSFGYKYTKQFTQMSYIADFITEISKEKTTGNGMKNLMCNISPVILSVTNDVVTEVTANMSGNKAIDECLQRFPKEARITTYFENLCYLNVKITTNLDLLFEAIDEFEDALTAPRGTASRGLIPYNDPTSSMIKFQSVKLVGAPVCKGETECYYNVDLMDKRQPPPIRRQIHDIFLQIGFANCDSCIYDTINAFYEAVSQIEE
ncbi:MAG: hypothetical protein EZS28_001253 [Streblomastix strix]|uniref:Uncharacterized protein n=1 Tax=Streblomastix strix TaxID=222440 RepID=A0A5J4X7J8_9EUKA|nr:MAG: hypothetical protein EZS28_001253 [Streblomastix strix]